MNKKTLIGLLILVAIIVGGYFICDGMSKQMPSSAGPYQATDSLQKVFKNNSSASQIPSTSKAKANSDTTSINSNNNVVQSNWKAYANTDIGLSFQYPDNWIINGQEMKMTDQSGNVMVNQINFKDTSNKTTLLVAHHKGAKGIELYNYQLSQFRSSTGWYATGGKLIKIAGKDAIEANRIDSINGKGRPIHPSLHTIIIDVLDAKETGEYELQFQTPVVNETKEIAKFNQLLSSLRTVQQD